MTENRSCFFENVHAKNPFIKTIRSCFYFFYQGRGIFLGLRYKNRSCKIFRSCSNFMLNEIVHAKIPFMLEIYVQVRKIGMENCIYSFIGSASSPLIKLAIY
jgi:hypothetical protein